MVIEQKFRADIATRYGLKEAIVFAIIRLYYIRNGNKEVLIPLNLIIKRTPYMSMGTLKRVVANLKKYGLIETRKGYDDFLGLGNYYEITEKGKEIYQLP